MNECLVISCSARKRRAFGPAIDLYDGNLFRILRKHHPNIDLFILSAKYGLIPAHLEIKTYDRHIKDAKTNLTERMLRQWDNLELRCYHKIWTLMGQDYATALSPIVANKLRRHQRIYRLAGGPAPIGKMQASLKDFCIKGVQMDAMKPTWAQYISENGVENTS